MSQLSSRTRLAAGAVNCLQSRSAANRARERDTELTGRLRTQKVIKFLINCGNKNLQYLLVPSRLEAALAAMDTDNDGHIDIDEWCVSELYNLGCLRRGDDALR